MAGEIIAEYIWSPVHEPAANVAFLRVWQCCTRGNRQGRYRWKDVVTSKANSKGRLCWLHVVRQVKTSKTYTQCVCVHRHMSRQMWTEQTADLGVATTLRAPFTKLRSAPLHGIPLLLRALHCIASPVAASTIAVFLYMRLVHSSLCHLQNSCRETASFCGISNQLV